MRICFTSDLHGRLDLYDQLGSLLLAERPDVLILGGDMHADGVGTNPAESQVASLRAEILPRIRAWRAALPGLTAACIFGNHDWACTEAALQQMCSDGSVVVLKPEEPWRCNGLSFVGFSLTPPTPFYVKDFERLDLPADAVPLEGGAVWDANAGVIRNVGPDEHFRAHPSLAQELTGLRLPADPCIFVCHAPPHGGQLDRLPNFPEPIGSRAVAQFIRDRQPLCSLHGHVHESPDVTGAHVETIGRTVSVNPGQGSRQLHAVLFEGHDPAGTLRHTVYG